MFDDPKKDLKWLEQQLLAVEAPQEEDIDLEEWLDDEILSEEDPLEAELQEARALLGDVPARQRRQSNVFAFLEEDIEDEVAPTIPVAPAPRPHSNSKEKQEKARGVGGLVFLACLETLGIIAVLLWWVIWLL